MELTQEQPVEIYYFGDIRKDYADLREKIGSNENDFNALSDIAFKTSYGYLYANNDSSRHDQAIIFITTDAEEYWRGSRKLREKLGIESTYNLPWPLHFFQERSKSTAAALLVTYEAVSTVFTSAIDKDALINMDSNMLAVYLTPVAAVILTFIAVAAYTNLKKEQNSNETTLVY